MGREKVRCTEKKYRNIEGKGEILPHTGSVIRGESKEAEATCREKNETVLEVIKRQPQIGEFQ